MTATTPILRADAAPRLVRAPAGRRIASGALDGVSALGAPVSLAFCTNALAESSMVILVLGIAAGALVLGSFVVIGVAQTGCTATYGQTLGMRVWGLGIVDEAGAPCLPPPIGRPARWMLVTGALALAAQTLFRPQLSPGGEVVFYVVALGVIVALAIANWLPLASGNPTLTDRASSRQRWIVACDPKPHEGMPSATPPRRAAAFTLDAALLVGPLAPLVVLVFRTYEPQAAVAAVVGFAAVACIALASIAALFDTGRSVGAAALSLRALDRAPTRRGAAVIRSVFHVAPVLAVVAVVAHTDLFLHAPWFWIVCGGSLLVPINLLAATFGGRTLVDRLAGVRVVHCAASPRMLHREAEAKGA